MDRPMGPRRPDKRNAAYESIFGRPSTQHHQLTPGPPPPAQFQQQFPQQQPSSQPYPYYPQYSSQLDRRTSTASFRPYQQQQVPPNTFRQSYYPNSSPSPPNPVSQQQGYQPPAYSQHQYGYAGSLAPPSIASRARSIGSAPGVIAPLPEEPPDPALEALTRSGLTPAQAYQAQVYMNNGPMGQQQSWLQQQQHPPPPQHNQPQPPSPSPARSAPTPASPSRPDGPRGPRPQSVQTMPPALDKFPELRINIEADDGRLGLDFINETSFGNGDAYGSKGGPEATPPSDPTTEDDSSELPYSKPYHTSTPNSVRSRVSVASGVGGSVDLNSSVGHSHQSSSRPYPLQLDTAIASAQAAGVSISPASSTLVDEPTQMVHVGPAHAGPSGRRSSESARTLPGQFQFQRNRSITDRSHSMSAAMTPHIRAMIEAGRTGRPPVPSSVGPGRDSPHPRPRRTPIVYPALLSRVAEAFKERIQLSDRLKDGLTYKDAFDGREAVDTIAYIIKTTDRNLALLLGRALDAQKFFHAVTYDHRLRDSSHDLYQFRTKLPSPFVSGELANIHNAPHEHGEILKALETPQPLIGGAEPSDGNKDKESPSPSAEDDSEKKDGSRPGSPTPSVTPASPTAGRPRAGSIASDDVPLPTGVFTLLTDCYSPTCTRDQLCYSIACPRRLEQQARLNMKPQRELKKQISKESLGELVEAGTLWIHTVPAEVVASVSDAEKKRQEAINEVIYTERDFVRDMEYLRDLWMKPLKESDIIPEPRRQDFIEQVFWNIHDIIAVNTRLRDALNKRQKSYAVVEQIGDVLLEAVPHFHPFVSYGAHQLYGKYEFEKEKSSNPAFARFVEATERRPESRKLELNGYLTKPTTRLARYPLLLEAVLKHTPEDNPDKTALPKAIEIVREFLKAVNAETGKAENRFNLLQLDQQLVFRPGEQVDLRLKEEGRELIYKGALKKRGNAQGDSGDLMVFLFDHALLMVKPKSKVEQYKVYRRPIPLELLLVSAPDDYAVAKPMNARQKQLIKNSPHAPVVPVKDAKGGFSITFVHLGRKYYQITLWASTYVSQRKWVEHIQKQQDAMRERSNVFETVTINEGFFVGVNRVNCAAPFYQGRKAVYGTDDGVYLSNLMERNREPVKVLALKDVAQLDVLEEYQLLIVLSERQVITFPLDALDPMDPLAGLKRAKRIASHISFFKAGVCLGKTLVCVVKSSPLSSTIKTLEPIDQQVRGRAKPTFKKLLQGGNDTLRVFKEFYIPLQSSSIHFLKTKLCVGCTNGFEIVDLETLDTQGLLDPADASLEFVHKRENLKPLAIYRIDNEFLLCYDEFAFYVNKTGWRSRKDFMVYWEGSPTGFALHYPYVLAFEPTFVEIRHVETGSMSQIIQGNNLRCLFADTPPSTTNSSSNYYSPYQVQQLGYGGYNPYAQDSRTSMSSNGYGSPGQYPNPYMPRPPLGDGRDEILMVSDDRVMRLQMTQTARAALHLM
ncbi:CNH-domain-containing protein [Dichomitus squalens LYAD-421 SS1]|uniref:CNH-domain-containing protein n=1 Tax=Dichomitus squalens (strain LYAD-421) TaxID=732165 RepID=R7SS76_DICSQ|nr:CNH-domain-containing protein [Dichomitus squalens LYAD-421 SS1]EJF59044.1 CNH-domain-containing protein [Dichomitus squalens LYAD-421 SS1]